MNHASPESDLAGLPGIAGGWELQPLAGPEDPELAAIELWAPARPDLLFDPDEAPASAEFHGAMPYWAWLWDSAPRMVRALERRGLEGRVLEVGAGLGAVGIGLAARSAGKAQVTLTDYDPLSIAVMRANAVRHGLPRECAQLLDWRSIPEHEAFDAIIGCEVTYDPTTHSALLDVFERLLTPGGQVYLADPGRERVPQFQRRARERGFSITLEDEHGAPAEAVRGEFRMLVLSL